MKPKISILNRAFVYTPSYATAIAETWRRFGWQPVRRNTQKQQARSRTSGETPRTWQSDRATYDSGSI